MEMPDFLNRFGQRSSDGTAHFSNVRKGLIVGLVYLTNPVVDSMWLTFAFIVPLAFDWDPRGCIGRGSDR